MRGHGNKYSSDDSASGSRNALACVGLALLAVIALAALVFAGDALIDWLARRN